MQVLKTFFLIKSINRVHRYILLIIVKYSLFISFYCIINTVYT